MNSLNKILNKNNIRELDSLIDTIVKEPEKVVVFLGNGVSRLAGVPSWDDLATCLLYWCYKEYDLHYDTYISLKQKQDSIEKISIAYEFIKKRFRSKIKFEQNFIDKLKFLIVPKEQKKEERFNKIYEHIANLKVACITTNYYTGLYNNKISEMNKIFFDDFAHPEMFNKNNIAYIHGELNKSKLCDIVLTLEQYLNKYAKSNSKINAFLSKIFTDKKVLFIGFGLRENEIIQHLVTTPEGTLQHYLLRPRFKYENYIDKEYTNYYKTLHIKLINYNISKRGYDTLEDILLYMSNKVIEERDKADVYKNKQKKAMLSFIRE